MRQNAVLEDRPRTIGDTRRPRRRIERLALVCAPFAAPDRPALGPSILKPKLEALGVATDILYLNLDFLDVLGLDLYYRIVSANPSSMIGEWLFSKALFGDGGDDPAYLAFLEANFPELLPTADEIARDGVRKATEAWLQDQAARLAAAGYDTVGFTSLFQQNLASLALARAYKRRVPTARVLFGGANVEGGMGRALLSNFPFIDACFSGEADEALPGWITAVNERRRDRAVPGLTERRDGRTTGHRTRRASVSTMRAVSRPDYEDYRAQFTASALPGILRPTLFFETSRGCWWGQKSHCTFCGLNGGGMEFRSKSPEQAYDDILDLHDRYGTLTDQFEAVDNILDHRYVSTLLPRLAAADVSLRLFYEIKANLRRAHVVALRDAGIRNIQPGIESLSSSHLARMGKGVSKSQNVQLLKWGTELGVEIGWNILLGLPGETEDECAEILDAVGRLGHLAPPFRCSRFRLDRFSPLFEKRDAMGVTDVRPLASYRAIYPEMSDADLFEVAYYFEFERRYTDRQVALHRRIEDAVERWRARAGKAVLTWAGDAARVTVTDGRSGDPRDTVLDGDAARLFLALDEKTTLPAAATASGLSEARAAEIAATFERETWTLADGKAVLHLAVAARGDG